MDWKHYCECLVTTDGTGWAQNRSAVSMSEMYNQFREGADTPYDWIPCGRPAHERVKANHFDKESLEEYFIWVCDRCYDRAWNTKPIEE